MTEKTLTSVLLADRHLGLTEGVRRLLETMFNTVVMVADETSLLESADRLHPTIAVVDVSLARDRSLGWLQRLRERWPDLKLIVLSIHDEPSVRRAVMKAGADRARRFAVIVYRNEVPLVHWKEGVRWRRCSCSRARQTERACRVAHLGPGSRGPTALGGSGERSAGLSPRA